MSFSVRVKGLDDFRQSLEKLRGNLITAELLENAGRTAAEMIQNRTARGIDASGALFQAYSDGWKKKRLRLSKQTSTVDLSFSGGMLGAMRVNAYPENGEAVISFDSSAESERAYFHGVTGVGAAKVKRRFLGLTELEAGAVEETIKSAVSKALGGA